MLNARILSILLTLILGVGHAAAAGEADASDWDQFATALRDLSKNSFRDHLVIPASVARRFAEREERTERENLNYLWRATDPENVLHLTSAEHEMIENLVNEWIPKSPGEDIEALQQRLAMIVALTERARGLHRSNNPKNIRRLRQMFADLYDQRTKKLDLAVVASDEARATDLRADLLRIASESFLFANLYDPSRRGILQHVRVLHSRIMVGAVTIVALAATAWRIGYKDHPLMLAASAVFPLVAEVFKRVDLARFKQGRDSLLGRVWLKNKIRRRWLAQEGVDLNQPSPKRSIDFTPSEMSAACSRYLERAAEASR